MTDKEKFLDLLKTGREDIYVGFTWVAYDTDSTDTADDYRDEVTDICNKLSAALGQLDGFIEKLEAEKESK